MMRLADFTMRAYGSCTDVEVPLGRGLTVVLGGNESGKSTALDALSDLLWGIPLRSPRAYVHARGALRVDATIQDGESTSVVVRRAGGLFATDLVTEVANPWDPTGSGSADWWRTRLGLTLDQLRSGGREVFAGGGDLAEAVFAAREGRSARLLLQSLRERRDSLFKGDRRAKNVRIREALAAFDDARERRDATVTRSGSVSRLREQVEHLRRELDAARRIESDADRRVRIAEEDARAIPHVRAIAAARADLAQIEAEGARVSDEHLADLREVTRAAAGARLSALTLSQRIEELESVLDGLVVDDEILLDSAAIERLRLKAGERISELRRADEEHAPTVRAQDAKLGVLVGRLGLDAVGVGDAVLESLEIPAPLVADVTDVADRLARADGYLAEMRAARDETVALLEGRGLVIDAGARPRPDVFEALRSALVDAHARATMSAGVLTRARLRLEGLQATGANPAPARTVDHADVSVARDRRDGAWRRVRSAWTTGELPADDARTEWAVAVDNALEAADALADRAADEKATTSAHDARLEAEQAGVAGVAAELAEAERDHDEAGVRLADAERSWSAAWLELGVTRAPSPDVAAELLGLIVRAVEQQALVSSAQESGEQARRAWHEACARASLPEGTTPSGWYARVALVAEITSSREEREAAALKEDRLRQSWAAFCSEVEELLVRHGVLDDALAGEESLGAVSVERGLSLLDKRCSAAAETEARRRTLDDRRRELLAERQEHERIVADEQAVRRALASEYGIEEGPGLDDLVERAERAAAPLGRLADARNLLEGALDAGSTVDAVIERLGGADQESVSVVTQAARDAQQAARDAALDAAGLLSEAGARLRDLESAGSAADAEAAAAERLGELVALTEEWSVVALQVVLLERTLERMGTEDTGPLLDRAGRILERITDGRYLALRADETPAGRTLQVIGAAGDRILHTELSEGTGDQVYFALRMAAVVELHEQRLAASLPALPLVLDDVLMAFDDERALSALQVLHELAPDLQVVVFTHHVSIAEAAQVIGGITITRMPAPPTVDTPLDGAIVRATVQQESVPASVPAPVRAAVARDAKDERAAAREWAQSQGIPVSARGRLPEEILKQYRASRS
jgi:uncharacterized protein YhaN